MSRAAGRALAAAALGAVAAAAWLGIFYALGGGLHAELDVTPPPALVRGLYPAERDRGSGLTFAWTGPSTTISLPGLDRNLDWVFTMRVRGARPGDDNPELLVLVDGLRVDNQRTTAGFRELAVRIPARPERTGLTLDLRSSATFVPGPSDPRALGVMVDWLRVTPDGVALPPRAAFAGAVVASAASGAALALLGVSAGTAVGGVALIAAGQAALIARGFGAYTGFPQTLAGIAVGVGVALVVLSRIVRTVRRAPLRNTAKFAAAFAAMALVLKAGTLMHPDMPIGDALFHAHRFRTVLAGNLYFTSIAPGNYAFPYPPGLYVFAAPFWEWLPRVSGDMALLRFIVLAVDAVASVLLYALIVRARGDRLAGACAVALYHLVPLDFRVATVGNLTNAFAQSVSVFALAVASSPALRLERAAIVALFAALLTAAFLSHTGAFALLGLSVVIIAVLFRVGGGPALRSPAAAVLIAAAIAVVAATALYYAHFMDTYRQEFARIGTETAAGAPAPGGRSVIDRLLAVPRDTYLYLGIPAVLLAFAGAGHLRRIGARDRLTLCVAGLTLACLVFLVVGVLTPVDLRHYLAAIPAVAVAAGYGASSMWGAGGRLRAAAALLLAWAIYIGVETWWTTLR
jgi:hypothetical protein